MNYTLKLITPYKNVCKQRTFNKKVSAQAYMLGLFKSLQPYCIWWRPVHGGYAQSREIEFSNGFRITCDLNIFAVMNFDPVLKAKMEDLIVCQIRGG